MISVIIPVYNGEAFIKEAIESVIRQNIDGIEILVIDDGSTDHTKDIVAAMPYESIVYLYQENQGPSHARNLGLKKARYDYISFLDADDVWPASKLHTQLNAFHISPLLEMVGGLIEYLYMPGSEDRKKQLDIEKPVFNVQLGALLVRKEIVDIIGYFNENMRLSEDQDWLLRAREKKISIHILNEVMLYYRIHPGNVTKHKTTKDLHVLKALKLSLDRRRASGIQSLPPIEGL
jgi:glycosyltransferase involved in cell wall biosynthesis